MSENDRNIRTENAAEDASNERGEQTVTVEDVGPARKRVTIEVPAERITDKLDLSYKRLKSDSTIPGFRRGRAPMRLIERRFSSAIRDDVRGELISQCYTQAVEDEKLDVIGQPDIKDVDKIELPDEGPLTFEVEVEVAPTFKLPQLEGIEVNKPLFEVTDQDVDGEIDLLGKRLGSITVVEEGAVEADDVLIADIRILAGLDANDEAKLIDHHTGVNVLVPSEAQQFRGQVVGLMVDDLGRQLVGNNTGDVVRISMTGPANHEKEQIKDQPISIVIQIGRIHRIIPADMDAILAIRDMKDVDELRQHVRDMLEIRAQGQQLDAMREQVRKHLNDKVDLELPENLSGRQSTRLLRRLALDLASQGVPPEQIELRLAEARAGSEKTARVQLKLFFIVNAVAKELGVEVSDEQVNGCIARMAVEQGRRPEKLRQQMQHNGELEYVELLMREHQTLDRILANASITEVDAKVDDKAESNS